jgi:hypothetical protein
MKYEGLVYSIGIIMVFVGTFMKLMHLQNANVFLMFSLIGICLFQGVQIKKLKKVIKNLENNVPKNP